jgi:dTMP kinase
MLMGPTKKRPSRNVSPTGPHYVAFEGGEGSGKSTQALLLAKRVSGLGTCEPGGTELGSSLRRLLLGIGEAPVGTRAETLMMAADRAQHLEELVLPTLASGRHVISDRSAYSSLAYQGGGRRLGVDAVRELNDWAVQGRWPDVVVLLDLALDEARNRLDRTLDRLEQEAADFHHRVGETFRQLAEEDPERWFVVSAQGSIEQVSIAVWTAIGHLFDDSAVPEDAGQPGVRS